MKTKMLITVWMFCFLTAAGSEAKMPPPIEECAAEPIKYVGGVKCDKRYYDGRLRYAIGVHSYQAMRANRTKPPEGGMIGWTYNHQPYLCYWKGRFYLEYLSNLTGEHVPPGRTLLMTSKDGFHWSNPQVIFPEYALPEIKRRFSEIGNVDLPAGTFSVMHQRMGFYIAPDGRLLALAFYSFCPTPFRGPNNGQGLGRVVREVHEDGTFGPIYFIRYNRHSGWNEKNTNYPFYKESPDTGFVKACDNLLADKLMTLQWQEEDMADDGFFAVGVEDTYKAFSWCHRPDGVVVGVWKNRDSALSPDNGKTWTKIGENKSLMTCGAKTWIQKTDDGRYALVYNHSATKQNRYPMTVMTSDDAHIFDDLFCLNGECPPMRFFGMHKNYGTQYFRGIVEGNGNPPANHMWNTYSVNKEDIWVSRTPVPITGTVDRHFSQDFQKVNDESELSMWNLYVPKWAPISVVEDPVVSGNKCLELRDEEPYDYAIAQRAFPESKKVTVEFRIYIAKVGTSFLHVEVQDKSGYRPMCLRFDDQFLMMDRFNVDPDAMAIEVGRWYHVRMELDCDKREYALYVDGKEIHDDIEFARTDKVESVERLVFRTGPWRGDVRQFTINGEPATKGLFVEDLYGTDDKSPPSVYLIDNVRTSGSSQTRTNADVPIENVIVYKEPGRFCGWPANNGIWNWGNEILVGFHLNYYKESENRHSIDRDKPRQRLLARSLDGGRSWTIERPEVFQGYTPGVTKLLPSAEGIDFTHPGFAMTCRSSRFYISYDRGRNWQGPYKLPDFGQQSIMARTDYIVNNKNDCSIFLTSTKTNGKEGRPFCARTHDAGKTIEFVSWIAPEPTGYSIMPSTVRVSPQGLVSAIRRYERGDLNKGWIEIYGSDDNGQTWQFLSKAADTGGKGGNPPSMVRLRDGRLCVTYAYRSRPHGVRAVISTDNGKTWGDVIHLRDDGRTWDIGYTRTVQRPDGELVTAYYYTTRQNPQQHIACTIWDPAHFK